MPWGRSGRDSGQWRQAGPALGDGAEGLVCPDTRQATRPAHACWTGSRVVGSGWSFSQRQLAFGCFHQHVQALVVIVSWVESKCWNLPSPP